MSEPITGPCPNCGHLVREWIDGAGTAHVEPIEADAGRAPERPEPPQGTRLILASENILEQFGTRTEHGEKITAEWGDPAPEGWYTPTFTVHIEDTLSPATRAAELDADTLVVDIAEAVKRVALAHGIKPTEFLDAIRSEYVRLSASTEEPGSP